MGVERSGLRAAMWVVGVLALGAAMVAMVVVKPKPAEVASHKSGAELERELTRSRRRVDELAEEVKQLRARIDSIEVTASDAARLARTAPTVASAPAAVSGSFQNAPQAVRAPSAAARDTGGSWPAAAAWARSPAQSGSAVIGSSYVAPKLSHTDDTDDTDTSLSGGGAPHLKPLAKLVKVAGLDDQQQAKVRKALDEERKRAKELTQQARKERDPAKAKAEVAKLRMRTNKEVKGVLSDDQYASYAKMRRHLGAAPVKLPAARGR